MRAVDDFQQVLHGLYFWQGYDSAVKADLSSCALELNGRLYFFDPVPLAAEPLERLLQVAPPAGIILTNGNHARGAEALRKKIKVPVFAHAGACDEAGLKIDRPLGDGETVTAGLTAVHLPGAGPGEIAVFSEERGLMVMGDALIHMEPHGLAFLPDKYCSDPKRMRVSLGKLLQFSFQAMTFAHGLPVVSGARQRLEQLLESA